jgi:hypothetical protein
LLLEYAQQLHSQAAAAAAAAAGASALEGALFDVPSSEDLLLQLQQEAQQLQELAVRNSSKPGALLALADAAAATASAAAATAAAAAAGGSGLMSDLTTATAAAAGVSDASSADSSMLWAVQYAPVLVQQRCGNAAAATAFQTFLSDWKSLIQQHAAAAPAGGKQPGEKTAAGAAAESDAETESSWFQSTRSGWGSSVCDEASEGGR